MHQSVGADEFGVHHIGAIALAQSAKRRVAHIFHGRQQEWKFAEFYGSYFYHAAKVSLNSQLQKPQRQIHDQLADVFPDVHDEVGVQGYQYFPILIAHAGQRLGAKVVNSFDGANRAGFVVNEMVAHQEFVVGFGIGVGGFGRQQVGMSQKNALAGDAVGMFAGVYVFQFDDPGIADAEVFHEKRHRDCL
jgi:hypothetical protein